MTRSEPLLATIRIAATPDDVFPFFVEPELMNQWLSDSAELNPQPGGVFAFVTNDNPVRGTYVSVEPPTRVVFTWGDPTNVTFPSGSSTVEVRLTAEGNETLVELSHWDLPEDQHSRHERGWAICLSELSDAARKRATPEP